MMNEPHTTTDDRLAASSGAMAPGVCGAVVVIVDQLTKLATRSADCGPVICPLHNDALFLGIGGGSGISVLTTGLGGLALFILWVRFARRYTVVPAVAVAIVAAGIVANTMDRLTLGAVHDFLAVPGGVVVNLADVAIVGGLLACVASVVLHFPSTSERG
jgi:lipoprotein signal peptidase